MIAFGTERSADVLSVQRLEQCMSVAQFVQQCLCVLQVGGVEALGEPVVDFGEHRARLITAASASKQTSEACGRPQLPPLRPALHHQVT